MCRLFGVVTKGNNKLRQDFFEKLTLLSKHGGPDSTGYYYDDKIQLGFNRLAILGIHPSGNQPMDSPTGRYKLLLNGEIYNFKDLADKYALQGLKSGSDTEVVAHLLDKLPIREIPSLLNGMFSIAIWDKINESLFLIRDFAGIKPLFYANSADGLIFSSQFNQILLHPWFSSWAWSAIGLREYLQFGFMPAPLTVAEQVFQLEPGTWLEYSPSTKKLEIQTYLTFFGDKTYQKPETGKSVISEAKKTIQSAVNRQLISDVPLGVFLSSGVDSSIIAAIAAKSNPNIETLTIGFEQKQYDESEVAASYASSLRIKNQRIIFSDHELLESFEAHNEALTEPFADYSSLPTYLISKVASKSFKVMLSGDGGDELFWGYPRFKTFAQSAKLFRIPTPLLRKITKKALKSIKYDVTGYLHKTNIGDANLAFHSYIESELLNDLWHNSTISSHTEASYMFQSTNSTQTLSYLRKNEFYQHLQKILVKVDRMSMANGLEVRVPLLDKTVIQFAETLKPDMLLKHSQLKFVLKNIQKDLLPPSIINETKVGFTPPLRIWARSTLKETIYNTLKEGEQINLPIPHPKDLVTYGLNYLTGSHNNLEGMWTIYGLFKWYDNLKRTASIMKV